MDFSNATKYFEVPLKARFHQKVLDGTTVAYFQ